MEALAVAIGQDRRGRHYFVSVDGLRYRHVPRFPAGPGEAWEMFGAAREEEHSKLQLLAEYRDEIAFVPMLGGPRPRP